MKMIIVTGSILAKSDTKDKLLLLSLKHSRRSRTEPGCLLHGVHQDCEDSLRLVFVEEWSDRESLAAHFALPASRAFVKEASMLAAEPPKMNVYETIPIRV
jgi:quinol monooxygenase YgiN